MRIDAPPAADGVQSCLIGVAAALSVQRVLEGAQAFRTQTRLRQHSNPSLFVSENSAGKRFGEARDPAGIFGDGGRSWAAETALSRVSGGKAAESQRLFRSRQEGDVSQDCVVADAVVIKPISLENSRLSAK